MVKTQTKMFGIAALSAVLMAAACGDDSNPTAPSATPDALAPLTPVAGGVPGLALPSDGALPGDGVISLKAPAPTLSTPANNATTEDLTPVLTITNAAPSHVSPGDAPFTYEFEVYKVEGSTMTRVALGNNITAGGGSTSYTVSPALEQTTTYMWRARAKIGDEAGPWASAYTFTTPTLVTIGIPTPTSPANGSEISSSRPNLVVTNPTVSANAGAIQIDYQIDDDPNLPNPSSFSVAMGGGGTTTGQFADALQPGTYGWRARATNGTVTSDWSNIFTFTLSDTGSGPRTPDPAPGQRLPLPDQSALIQALEAANPQAMDDSCVEEGGTWEFMDLAVEALRATDTRWGYNCKRGDCNHISIDVVNYFYGSGSGNLSTDVYIIDIIHAVCPDGNQRAAWIDQTQVTADHGTIGVWIYPRPQ